MKALCEVITQCLATQKALTRLQSCVSDEYFKSVLAASLHALNGYVEELRPWLKREGNFRCNSPITVTLSSPEKLSNPGRLRDVCNLRLELLQEAFGKALTAPLPSNLIKQLHEHANEFSDIRLTIGRVLTLLPSEDTAQYFSWSREPHRHYSAYAQA